MNCPTRDENADGNYTFKLRKLPEAHADIDLPSGLLGYNQSTIFPPSTYTTILKSHEIQLTNAYRSLTIRTRTHNARFTCMRWKEEWVV